MSRQKRDAAQVQSHMDGLRKRVVGQLRELGIDVETIGTNDRSVVMASKALAAMGKAMRAGKRPVVWPTAPTPERVAKSGRPLEIELQPDQPKAHAFVWPVDRLRTVMEPEEYAAACRFYRAFQDLHGVSKVSGYGDSGGGGYRPGRLELTERQELAGREFAAMEKALMNWLGPLYSDCARNFILEVPISGSGRCLDWVQFGRLFGNPGDDGAARILSRGALRACCALLARAAAEFDGKKAEARQRRTA